MHMYHDSTRCVLLEKNRILWLSKFVYRPKHAKDCAEFQTFYFLLKIPDGHAEDR